MTLLNWFSVLFLTCSIQAATPWHPKSPKDCRLAFLLGATDFTGQPPSIAIFPKLDDANGRQFDEVARLYAEDLGVSAADLTGDKWRETVSTSLAKYYGEGASHRALEQVFGDDAGSDSDLAASYLAGAYSQHGTTTGFQLVNARKGLYLVWLVRFLFGDVFVDATLRPGVPGNVSVTIRDGRTQTLEGFVHEMEAIRLGIVASRTNAEPNNFPQPAPPSRRG